MHRLDATDRRRRRMCRAGLGLEALTGDVIGEGVLRVGASEPGASGTSGAGVGAGVSDNVSLEVASWRWCPLDQVAPKSSAPICMAPAAAAGTVASISKIDA